MRKFGAALVLAFLLGGASQAHASMFSLGADMALSIHHPEFGDNTTIFGLPGATELFQPGFRFGIQPGAGTHELYLDTGLLSLSGGGDSFRALVASANYQYNFSHAARTRPYLTAGFGLLNQHVSSSFGGSASATSGIGGGGVGIRQWLAGDQGSLRFEARYDRIGRSKHDEIGKAGVFSLKVGFDLWVK